MKIVIQYDPDVSSAPAGFKTAVNEAVAYLDRLVSSNISLTVEFGWGQSDGLNGNQATDAAISEPATVSIFEPTPQNTTAVVSALTAAYATNGLSAWITPSVLTADFATTSQFTFFELGLGQAEAMNLTSLQSDGSTPGLVALNTTLDWNFDTKGPSNPNFIDAVSALLHEITHDMGRVAGFTSGTQTIETQFDMLRYNGQGQLQTAPGGGFFSLNGHVLTLPFEAADMDPADWTDAVAQDSNGFAPFGNAYNYSAVDMLELKALGYQLNAFTNSYLGDAQSEVLVQNTAGAMYVGALSGNTLQYTHIGSLPASQWTFVSSGDFLGDGVSDAMVVNTAGLVAVAEDVGGVASYTTVGTLAPSDWSFHGAGDFYGDENNEFLIENTAGAVYLGRVVSGHASYVHVTSLSPASEWGFRGVGNFLGDGKDGFLVENTANALYVGEVGLTNQTTFTQVTSPGAGWTFHEVGDFLGDGKDDFLIENTAGAVYVGEVGASHHVAFTHLTTLTSNWAFVGAGDFLGEGHDQFLIENTAGVVDLADWSAGAIHFTHVSTLSSIWTFH